jgi:hypothetical protein
VAARPRRAGLIVRTAVVILVGIALVAAFYAVARLRGGNFSALRPWFTGFWALATAVNYYVSVAFLSGSSVAEMPLFLLSALVPIAFAFVLPWLLERSRGGL